MAGFERYEFRLQDAVLFRFSGLVGFYPHTDGAEHLDRLLAEASFTPDNVDIPPYLDQDEGAAEARMASHLSGEVHVTGIPGGWSARLASAYEHGRVDMRSHVAARRAVVGAAAVCLSLLAAACGSDADFRPAPGTSAAAGPLYEAGISWSPTAPTRWSSTATR